MSGHGRTDLTFEPDPHYSPDAGTALFSPISYKRCYAAFYVGKIPRIRIGGPALQRGVVFKWFFIHWAVGYPLSEVPRSTECPASLLNSATGILYAQLAGRFYGYAAEMAGSVLCVKLQVKFGTKTANINVKNCCFITKCKADSKVTHIKQQNYFHHLNGRGYKDCVLYPRLLGW